MGDKADMYRRQLGGANAALNRSRQRERELQSQLDDARSWASEVMSVMLGWAMEFVDIAHQNGAIDVNGMSGDDIVEPLLISEFKRLYEKGKDIGLLTEVIRDGRQREAEPLRER